MKNKQMVFHKNFTIIYLLFSFLFILHNNGSSIENAIISVNQSIIQTNVLDNNSTISRDMVTFIFNHFLNVKDIMTLRKTCQYFQTIMIPNMEEHNMIMFRKGGNPDFTKQSTLLWLDLKFFWQENCHFLQNIDIIHHIKTDYYAIVDENGDIKIWKNDDQEYTTKLFYQFINEDEKIRIEKNPIMEKILTKMPKVISNGSASITINSDGSVVAYGNKLKGGEIFAELQKRFLKHKIKKIVSSSAAFSVLFTNGHVCAWGSEDYGGKVPITNILKNVKQIFSNPHAFVALKKDGSIIAWGNPFLGGKIPDNVQAKLKNVKSIIATNMAFTAQLENGSAFSWGDRQNGGVMNPENLDFELRNVKTICNTREAFAALKNDKSVFTWGARRSGGQIQGPELKQVKMLFSTNYAFAAILENGTIHAWGNSRVGGKIPDIIQHKLQNVQMIFSSDEVFVALKKNGSVYAWGNGKEEEQLIPEEIKSLLDKNVKTIFPQHHAFTFVTLNGEAVKWQY